MTVDYNLFIRIFGAGCLIAMVVALLAPLAARADIVVAGVIMTRKNRTAAEFSQPFGEAEQMASKALVSAVRNDSATDVSAALAAGADPNFVDTIGNTPLRMAVDVICHPANLARFVPSADIVGLLLDAGADPNLERIYGE